MTNYDLIKAMSVEQMAIFLGDESYRIAKPIFDATGVGITPQVAYVLRKRWLESEVQDNG